MGHALDFITKVYRGSFVGEGDTLSECFDAWIHEGEAFESNANFEIHLLTFIIVTAFLRDEPERFGEPGKLLIKTLQMQNDLDNLPKCLKRDHWEQYGYVHQRSREDDYPCRCRH